MIKPPEQQSDTPLDRLLMAFVFFGCIAMAVGALWQHHHFNPAPVTVQQGQPTPVAP